MNAIEARVATQTKRIKPATSAKNDKPKAAEKPSAKHTFSSKPDSSEEQHAARVTKHDRILALLSRRDGATITELMEASGWQQPTTDTDFRSPTSLDAGSAGDARTPAVWRRC